MRKVAHPTDLIHKTPTCSRHSAGHSLNRPLPSYLALWAKTSDLADGPRVHPLAYHLLDVAAVAEILIGRSRFLRDFAGKHGLDPATLRRFVLLLVALHDVGKASAHFQWRPTAADDDIRPRLAAGGFGAPRPLAAARHDEITLTYLTAADEDSRQIADLAAAFAPGLDTHAIGLLAQAVAGHHGRPVRPAKIENRDATANAPFLDAGGALARDLAALFKVSHLPAGWLESDRDCAAFSWFLSALTPVSDWLGSRQFWFPPRAADLSLADYWDTVARPRAARATGEAGLGIIAVARPGVGITLPFSDPTPLQKRLLTCPLPEGPTLFVIEDATGSGKTEAALTLAHRLMAAGRADGFYFALPTTATANAMYVRLAAVFMKLFETADSETPSLALSHGRVGRSGNDERDVDAFCAEWIADDRRRKFMAQGGAGTIDQALLTVLPAKYQSLRLFGLHGKILIVDEVHAFDSFVLRILTRLIELHAMLGGTTILMSATLPLETRRKLAHAHEAGLGKKQRNFSTLVADAYPLLTTIAPHGAKEEKLEPADGARRRVAVERIATVDVAERMVAELAQQGAAIALVRSTVDAALASFERLNEEFGDRVELLHSRFLPEDRARIEAAVLRRFGKDSTPETRSGRILVATQVIEQSLDLDFDALVTDLAPIDLLIQRAGRLWRHKREDRPCATRVLRVISPAPTQTDAADWLDETLREAVWVYQDAARLWLTAQRLFGSGEIVMATLDNGEAAPAHARRLVDSVYAPDAPLPTESLRKSRDMAEGKADGNKELADYAALKPSAGYGGEPSDKWQAEGVTRTRLEQPPRVIVRLAIEHEGALRPLAADGNWPSSEISVTEKWAQDLREPDEAERARLKPGWSEADGGVRLLTLAPQGPILSDDAGRQLYGRDRGLIRVQPTD